MIDWHFDVIARGLDGKTDAEIAASLPPVTVRDMDADAVEDLLGLGGFGLLYRDGGEWAGPLWLMKTSRQDGDPIRKAITWLTGHLDKPGRQIVRTTDPSVAVPVAGVLAALAASGGIGTAVMADFRTRLYVLGEGLRFAGVTAAEVAAARAAYAAEQRKAELLARRERALDASLVAIDAGQDAAAVRAAMLSAWDGPA